MTGLKDELKHVDRSIKQNTPELNKVCLLSISFFTSQVRSPPDLLFPCGKRLAKPSTLSAAKCKNSNQ